MDLKFCQKDDGRPAIGTGKRPMQWCREHYVSECGPEFEAWKVTQAVADAEDIDGLACAKTGEVIEAAGGTVWLDPVETNIPALRYAGFIEPLEAPKPAKAAKTEA